MAPIDRRLGWREAATMRKRGLDAALARYREGPRPTLDLGALLFAAGLIVAALVAVYYIGRADEAAAHTVTQQQLLDCMNGTAVWSHPNGSGKGYGKTVHKCRGVEEFDI